MKCVCECVYTHVCVNKTPEFRASRETIFTPCSSQDTVRGSFLETSSFISIVFFSQIWHRLISQDIVVRHLGRWFLQFSPSKNLRSGQMWPRNQTAGTEGAAWFLHHGEILKGHVVHFAGIGKPLRMSLYDKGVAAKELHLVLFKRSGYSRNINKVVLNVIKRIFLS